MTPNLKDLVRVDEIAKLAGVERPMVYYFARSKSFPDPVMIAGTVKFFDRAKVTAWIKAHKAHKAK